MTATFQTQILELNFSFLSQKEEGGVLLTRDYEKIDKNLATPDILFALETAKKFEADAVYFRFFQDGRAAVPQVYFFNCTEKTLSDKEKETIHIQMWNGYQVPIYIFIEKNAVSVFDARKKPQIDKSNYASEIIKLSGEAIKSFRAQDFDDGLFWDEHDKNFKFEQSATRDLIRGLKSVYKSFQEKSNLDSHVALKLLVQSLLVKYLEERDKKSNSGYFAKTYFKKNFQCENFCAVIRSGKLLDLLDQLSKDFNGKIFEWDKEDEKVARQSIQKAEVQSLANYLDAKIENEQYVLWPLYSFSHLPIEIISSVYEELLSNKTKDIVYTPEMVVSTMVDECMPLRNPQKNFKLIDVSCGSGIFLVKSYKRIIQWWRYENWLRTGELAKPSLAILKELLLSSIYGVDIESDAVRLSIFSLALAVLDEVDLDPPTWQKLKFPDLSNNIIEKDFFRFITEYPLETMSLVIGNPPFNLKEVNGKEPSRKKYFSELENGFGYKSEINIPDENPALHFLVQSMKLLRVEGLLCLIQPSGPLLYQNNTSFKEAVFAKYNLLQVIDFTKLSDKLWGKTNVATAAIFLQKTIPNNEDVLHLIANRNISNTSRLFLDFDFYDFYFISKHSVVCNQYIWKANLLGGGRIVQLIERLSKLPTLGNYLKKKRKENNWVFGEGFIKGKPDNELVTTDFERKKGGYSEFAYLENSLCVETKSFTEDGIGQKFILKDKFYQWGRTKELFQAPLLLIKKGIGKQAIPTFFSEESITYKHRIIGIHAPTYQSDELKSIDSYFKDNASLIRFYIASTSAEILVSRATAIFSEDILNIPFLIENTLNILSKAEEIILKDSLKYYLDVFNETIFTNITKEQIEEFSEIFCKSLNSVYEEEGKSFQLFKILDAGKYYALHFEYSSQILTTTTEITKDLEYYINEIIPEKKANQKKTHIQKIMKSYGQDTIILAKPKQLRYWLPSIALRDADESFADYIKARYHNA